MALAAALGWARVVAAAADRPPVSFDRDIKPILSDACFACHGPDASHREADLRLDIREAAVAMAAIVPGRPDESEVVVRILESDPDLVMPPPSTHKKLDARHKDLIIRWIQEGAEYERHWSYVPPVKPAVPDGVHGVDHLVRSRLKAIGLTSAAEADRRTLIRRLSFDLTGLPPTANEVAAFERDRSPDAYAKLVDRLLASPHYGERMAVGWLDVVRFADTIGYHSDNPRNVWPYRDWVIRSFNEDKPFDRFTIEQIAGDLLPDATNETRVGSAFNRLLLTTEENGAQAKDYVARMLTDRVRTLGAVWLGQTTGCAACHDHKFDPITMRDFYSLGAFFADVTERPIGKREDGLVLGTPEQVARLAVLDAAVAAAQKELDIAQVEWERDHGEAPWVLPELDPAATLPPGQKRIAKEAAAALQKRPGKRTDRDRKAVQAYFRSRVSSGRCPDRHAAFTAAAEERLAFYQPLPKCLVTVAKGKADVVRILPRGDWMDDTGEVVRPAFPAYLPAPKMGGREPGRLDLARWLVAREHPLTARVVMNRLWNQFFGAGLSRVLDDLGAQGEPRRIRNCSIGSPASSWIPDGG